MQSVELDGYFAKITESKDLKYLYFGTWGSYGIESIAVDRKNEWLGKTITATFSVKDFSIGVLVLEDGTLDIPPEATSKVLNPTSPGRIVFSAPISDDSKIVSTDIYFVVFDHGNINGEESSMTPSQYDQLVSMIDSRVPLSGKVGQFLKKGSNGNVWSDSKDSSGYKIGHGLTLDEETNTLSVHVANEVEKDNTLPISSAAVEVVVGNINVLLTTI